MNKKYQYLLGKVSTNGDPKKALVEFMYQYLLGKVSTVERRGDPFGR